MKVFAPCTVVTLVVTPAQKGRDLEADISLNSLKSRVGEEEVKEYNEINGIYECAGANAALTLNGNFEGRPHLSLQLEITRRQLIALPGKPRLGASGCSWGWDNKGGRLCANNKKSTANLNKIVTT